METHPTLLELREIMKAQLEQWIPVGDALIEKELCIFDTYSRREFLKHSVLLTSSLLLTACSSDNWNSTPPSQWPDSPDGTVTPEEQAAIQKPSKITIDADIMEGMNHHNPLNPYLSKDMSHIKADAVLETFNPHVMGISSEETLIESGFKPLTRNYGVAEIVQLQKENASSNYSLDIYEKAGSKNRALVKESIALANSASSNFDTLVVANGSFHNRIKEGSAYSQKMILLADTQSDSSPALQLFYQLQSHKLLQAGVTLTPNNQWKSIDIIELFQERASAQNFTKTKVLDIGVYHDALQHSFLYGTLQFDDLYNYGFSVAFNSIEDKEPNISFFTPMFLSKKVSSIATLLENFNEGDTHNNGYGDETYLKDFAIFAEQKFQPLAQLTDENGVITSEILFSFISFDTSVESNAGVYSGIDTLFDLSELQSSSSKLIKRYLMLVDSSKNDIEYTLEDFSPSLSIESSSNSLQLHFDTSSIGSVDLQSILNENKQKETFVRAIKRENDRLTVVLVSPFYNQNEMGITHQDIHLSLEKIANQTHFSLLEQNSIVSNFESALHDNKEYKELWFNEMRINSEYDSLASCVRADNDNYEFYCSVNHQGLLNSYFLINVKHSDGEQHNFLLSFSEKGIYPDPLDDAPLHYNSQTEENLLLQLSQKKIDFFPPLPVTINAKKLYPFYGVGVDEAVVFTTQRTFQTDASAKRLNSNENRDLLSYIYATLDTIEGNWISQELGVELQSAEIKEHLFTTTTHQLHLHLNNIYDYRATLDPQIYVELNFSKMVYINDFTFEGEPNSYHIGRNESIFLKANHFSEILLQVHSGLDNDSILEGATVRYRIIDTEDVTLLQNQAVSLIVPSKNTTAFQSFHISFKAIDRLSTKQINTLQEGVSSDTPTAYSVFQDNLMDGSQVSDIDKFSNVFETLSTNVKPLNTSPLSSAPLQAISLSGKCCHSIKKWAHKATKSIEHTAKSIAHSIKKEEEKSYTSLISKLAKAIDSSLSKLSDDIDTIAKNLGIPLPVIITMLKAYIRTVSKIDSILLFEYIALWRVTEALIEMNKAWDIGHELKEILHDQLSKESPLEHTLYDKLQETTANIQNDIDTFAQKVKDDIDCSIDTALNIQEASCNTVDKSTNSVDSNPSRAKELHKEQQKDSTKRNYVSQQTQRLYHTMQVGTKNESHELLCGDGTTVEELCSCILSDEVKQASTGIHDVVSTNLDLFNAIIDSRGIESIKDDLAKLLKESIDLMIDELKTVVDGTIEIPLSFLNGSSLLNALYKELDGSLKDLFEILGLLLFRDKDKFKTIDDFGYFSTGFLVNITWLLTKDFYTIGGDDIDMVDYVSSGKFRSSINSRVSDLTSRAPSKDGFDITVLVADSLDLILEEFMWMFEVANAVSWSDPLKTESRFVLMGRIICRVPSLIDGVLEKDPIFKIFATASDLTFMITHIVNFVKRGVNEEIDPQEALGWALGYAFINMVAAVLGITISTIRLTEKSDFQNWSQLTITLGNIIEALLVFYLEVEDEPDPRAVAVNEILTAIRLAITQIALEESLTE